MCRRAHAEKRGSGRVRARPKAKRETVKKRSTAVKGGGKGTERTKAAPEQEATAVARREKKISRSKRADGTEVATERKTSGRRKKND